MTPLLSLNLFILLTELVVLALGVCWSKGRGWERIFVSLDQLGLCSGRGRVGERERRRDGDDRDR